MQSHTGNRLLMVFFNDSNYTCLR